MKKFVKFLTVALAILTLALSASVVFADGGVSAYNSVKLDVLANQGLLKLNGRVRVGSGYLAGDFSGTGFSTRIVADKDTEFEVFVDGTYLNKISIWVDGVCKTTEMVPGSAAEHGKMIGCEITAGEHEVTVVKESQVTSSTTAYFHFDAIRFEGTVVGKVADKPLLVEVVGDSYSCGDGADAEYTLGVAWTGTKDDAITKSFGWYLADMLGADFREVGRGGQGLDGTAAQESQTNTVTMPILYDYMNYADQKSGTKWVETRTPNLVVIELGANDTSSASNKANWVAIAKNFLIKIETKYGGKVPIVWDFTNNKSYLYSGLREAVETDPQLSSYGNIYLLLNYLNGNGTPALASQSSGHPDAGDQYGHAERLYDFIREEGVLGVPKTVSQHQYVFYAAENGNNANDGLTAATAKADIPNAISAAKAYVATLGTIPADAEVVIKVTGTVRLTTAQNMTSGIEKGDLKFRADGSVLPLVLETLDFNGTNRATVRSDFKPVNSGNASTYCIAPTTFRNITIGFIKGAVQSDGKQYVVQKICAQYGDMTFDNATISTESGATVNVYANNFSYVSSLHSGIVAGTEERHHTVTFKNGTYNASTGFGTVAALGGVDSLWVSSSLSYYEAPGLTSEIVVAEGAVMDGTKLYINSSKLNAKEAILTVKTGGKVIGNFKGTTAGTSSAKKSVKTNLTVNINGGHFKGAFAMLGNYVDLEGDTKFVMTGGEIYVPAGTSEETNSIVLGGGFNSNKITGNEYKEIHGGLLYIIGTDTKDGTSVVQSGIHMSGRASQNLSGISENKMTAGAILLIPKNSSSKNTASSVYFGVSGGPIQTELRNILEGGIIDSNQYSNTIYFGGQATNAVVKKLTNVIGVESEGDRSVGPVFLCGTVALGSGWGQYGRTSRNAAAVTDPAAITSDTVVISTTIYGGDFNAAVTVGQSGTASGNTYYPRTEGSMEANVYGGRFTGDFTLLYRSELYGHITANLMGGFFKNIIGISGTSALITNGITMNIGDIHSFGQLAKSSSDSTLAGPYYITPLYEGTVKTLLSNGPALTLTVNGGDGKCGLVLNNDSKVLAAGETTSVSVNGGKWQKVYGTYGTGTVKGGWYAETPDAALLASGYTVKNFTQPVDSLYTCEVVKGTASDHTHCLCGGNAVGVGDHTSCDASKVWTPVMSYKDLAAAVTSGASMDGYYYLVNDIQLKGTIGLLANQSLHICLNGHTITAYPGSRAFSMYNANGLNAHLDITDCQEEMGTIQGGYYIANGGNILVFSGSSMNLYNGRIAGGQAGAQTTSQTSYGDGGNIIVGSGTVFNMYGGIIENGQARRKGGNLSVSGTANIYGGIIRNGRVAAQLTNLNEWIIGGNIQVSGTLNFKGGLVEGGKANYGGNIYTNKNLNISGGTVTGGVALTGNGGNILGDKNSAITVTGGTVTAGVADGRMNINADKNYVGSGGNIYVQGSLEMTDGTVSDGYAQYSGGNVFFNKDNMTLEGKISGGEITSGSARFGGNISIEGAAGGTKKVTVSDDADINCGTALYNAKGGDGHGGNFYLGTCSELIVTGGSIHDGAAGKTCGGGNISATGTDAVLRVSGGEISDAHTQTATENDVDVASIVMFASVPQTLTITGGTFGTISDAQVVLKVNSQTTPTVSGAYFEGTFTGNVGGYLGSNYVAVIPADKYLQSGYTTFTLDTAVESMDREFGYQIAKGFRVVTSTLVSEGQYSANLQGGGTYHEGETATLVAPASVGPYRFVRWQTEDGTELTTETTYAVTDQSKGTEFFAVYEFAQQNITLIVNGTNFKISKKEPAESAFTDATFTANTTKQYASGTEIVLTYLGSDDFAAWTNDNQKFVCRDTEYSFTLYIDTKLNEFITVAEPSQKKVSIVYMNAYNQVLKTVDSADVATDVPEIPAQIGQTTIGWDKTVADLQAAIEAAPAGEATTILVTPLYEAAATEGTVLVKKRTATAVTETGITGGAEVNEEAVSFKGTLSKALEVTAGELDGYEFACFADADGKVLSFSETYLMRPSTETITIYAVFMTTEPEKVPTISLSYTGIVTEGTAQADVTRTMVDGYTVVEQGFLLATPAMSCNTFADAETALIYGASGNAKMISKLDTENGLASLRMRGLTDTAKVFARGYLVYRNDATGEIGVTYADIVLMEMTTCSVQ